MGTTIVENEISKNQSPTAMAAVSVFLDEDNYFLEPDKMKDVVSVMSGNYHLHPFKEKSYDGYVTTESDAGYELTTMVESTEKIGEQKYSYDLTLKNKNGKTKHVRWSINQKTWEKTAIENCELHEFYEQTSPAPGETVYSTNDKLVVNIADLAKFFGKSYTYDRDAFILYIEEK